MTRRSKPVIPELPAEMPTTLEGKLDLALVAFGQLSVRLEAEQRSRRIIVLIGGVVLALSMLLNAGLFIYGQDKTSDLETATDQIETFQAQLCGFVTSTREFAIESTVALRESLISAFAPDEDDPPLTPEERAELEESIAKFREDLDSRIDALPAINCEVNGSG